MLQLDFYQGQFFQNLFHFIPKFHFSISHYVLWQLIYLFQLIFLLNPTYNFTIDSYSHHILKIFLLYLQVFEIPPLNHLSLLGKIKIILHLKRHQFSKQNGLEEFLYIYLWLDWDSLHTHVPSPLLEFLSNLWHLNY